MMILYNLSSHCIRIVGERYHASFTPLGSFATSTKSTFNRLKDVLGVKKILPHDTK